MSLKTQLQPTNDSWHLPLPPPPLMEIIAFAVSIVSLAGVFENAKAFFACIRVAKSQGSDMQTYTCRLKILHLRLARWGKVVGLAKEAEDVGTLKTAALNEQEVVTAEQVLEQIGLLFEKTKKAHPDLIEAPDANDDTMFEILNQMSICKPRKASIVEKAKWAVYKKEDLSNLVEDLDKLIGGLDILLTAHSDALARLSNEEASQLLEQGRLHASALALLEETAASLDTKLAEAIAKRKEQTAASSTVNNVNHGNTVNVGGQFTNQTNNITFGR